MNAISLRQINLALILGILLIVVTSVGDADRSRQYLGALFAAWSVFHTYKLHQAQDWRLDFIPLSPQSAKQAQYIVTMLILIAGVGIWFFSVQGYQPVTAWIMMFSTGLLFFKLVLTPT